MLAKRKAPSNGWRNDGINQDWTAWVSHCGRFYALSSLCMIDDGHQEPHQEWIISFSGMGRRRLTNAEIKKCLNDFDASDFEEDNHEPGIVRKFWMAVEHKYRNPCPCKDEMVITEDGYQYSVKKDSK